MHIIYVLAAIKITPNVIKIRVSIFFTALPGKSHFCFPKETFRECDLTYFLNFLAYRTFYNSKESFFAITKPLCNEKVLCMLKILYRTSNANKEHLLYFQECMKF